MAILRQTIMDAVATRMAGITTTGGAYHTNLGSNVIANRPRLIGPDGIIGSTVVEASELPCVIVRDGPAAYSEFTLGGKCRCDLSVEIEVRCESGTSTATIVRQMIADVYKAVGVDPKWGGIALMTVPVSDDMSIVQGDKIIGGAFIRITVSFITALWGES